MPNDPLPLSFYRRDDVLIISRELLGMELCTWNQEDGLTSGIITETEAYRAENDQANHASGGNMTKRNSVMFDEGGVAYIYLCYGIHHLFNVVTNRKGVPDAILIRAIKPLAGQDTILKRRNSSKIHSNIANGPGKLSEALGIDRRLYGKSLTSKRVWIQNPDISISMDTVEIITKPRVGIDYAGEDARLPWRFILDDIDFEND